MTDLERLADEIKRTAAQLEHWRKIAYDAAEILQRYGDALREIRRAPTDVARAVKIAGEALRDPELAEWEKLDWKPVASSQDVTQLVGNEPTVSTQSSDACIDCGEEIFNRVLSGRCVGCHEKAASSDSCDFCQGTGMHLAPDVAEPILTPCTKKGCRFVASGKESTRG